MRDRRLLEQTFGLMLVVLLLGACNAGQAEPSATAVPVIPTSTTASVSMREAPAYWPTAGWRSSTPEEQGMDSEKLADMLAFIQERQYDIDSVTIIRNGYMVLDVTFFPFPPDYKHNIYSCTKSIVSVLVGIAIEEGHIESPQERVLDLLPGRSVANLTADKEAMTLEHVLNMATGLKCQDSYLYRGRGIDEMWQSPDWVQFVLDLPMVEAPGTRFEYCNGASFLLSAIIQETTGMNALEFAKKHLFAPLGISDVAWPSNPRGITIGWSDLHIRPHDMAKIGYLYLNEGLWDGEQVVPSAWVEASTRKHIYAGTSQNGYGYQWWVGRSGIPMALGRGGQYIVVMPEKETVVVFTSDLSDSDSSTPERLLNWYIIPAAESLAPLPANPDGVAKLQTLIQEAAGQPKVTPQPVPPPPAIAEQVLGETYILEKNAPGWESFILDEAVFHLTSAEAKYQFGLDGVQGLATGTSDVPTAVEVSWEGDNVFVAEVKTVGEAAKMHLRLRFEDDTVTVTLTAINIPEHYFIQGKRAGGP